jgi:two-component system, OmpR family, alkaline phosphatase synthesis response regulator PhoP
MAPEKRMGHCLLTIENDRTGHERRVSEVLEESGHTVATTSDSVAAADAALAAHVELIIVHHSQPVIRAIDVCAELRRRNVHLPVIVLGARHDFPDRIAIFKAGADDYLPKPVDFEELQVRIEALLLRFARNRNYDVLSYEFGGMRVNFGQAELVRNGSTTGLSERESRLLRYFVENRGKTLSRNALLQHVWGYREAPLTRTVDVHILRLRQKIEENPKAPRYIVTVHGFGYRFDG